MTNCFVVPFQISAHANIPFLVPGFATVAHGNSLHLIPTKCFSCFAQSPR